MASESTVVNVEMTALLNAERSPIRISNEPAENERYFDFFKGIFF